MERLFHLVSLHSSLFCCNGTLVSFGFSFPLLSLVIISEPLGLSKFDVVRTKARVRLPSRRCAGLLSIPWLGVLRSYRKALYMSPFPSLHFSHCPFSPFSQPLPLCHWHSDGVESRLLVTCSKSHSRANLLNSSDTYCGPPSLTT